MTLIHNIIERLQSEGKNFLYDLFRKNGFEDQRA